VITPPRALTKPASYWRAARAPRYSLLFALPLLLLYEALAAVLSDGSVGGVRNGADVLLKQLLLAVAGTNGARVVGAILVGVCVWLVARDLRANRGGLRASFFAAMMAEAVVLALAFGVAVSIVTAQLLGSLDLLAAGAAPVLGWWTQLMISLGAGLYEELVFRVILVSALAAGGRALLGWRPPVAALVAVVISALVFSAFHYVGPYGDRLELQSFLFRAVAGLFFSGMYVLRGFGITAWTHALYDVFLLLR
jgi:membrane protease YdiL (CAAX protease family)